MKKKVELRIYELLGIKTFKKIVTKIPEITVFLFNFNKNKEERKQILQNRAGNYFIKLPYTLENIREFKSELFINSMLHLTMLIPSIYFATTATSILDNILYTFSIALNSYCIMLQRYNQLRINEVVEKMQILEEKRQKLNELQKLTNKQNKSLEYEKTTEITPTQIQNDNLKNTNSENNNLKLVLNKNTPRSKN